MDYEVKADALEDSFAQAGQSAELAQLRREVASMRAQRRPALDGAKGRSHQRSSFVDAYVRKGLDNVLCREAAAGFGQQISMRRQRPALHAF